MNLECTTTTSSWNNKALSGKHQRRHLRKKRKCLAWMGRLWWLSPSILRVFCINMQSQRTTTYHFRPRCCNILRKNDWKEKSAKFCYTITTHRPTSLTRSSSFWTNMAFKLYPIYHTASTKNPAISDCSSR